MKTEKTVHHRGTTLGLPPVNLRDTPGPIQKSQRHTGNGQNAFRLDGQSADKNLPDAALLLLILMLIILKLRTIEHSEQILLSLVCMLLFVVSRVDAYTEMYKTYDLGGNEVANDVIALTSGNYVLVGASRPLADGSNWGLLVIIIDSAGTRTTSYTSACPGYDVIGYGGALNTDYYNTFVVLAARPADCTGPYRPYLMKFTYSSGTLTLSWAKQCDQVVSEGRKVLYLYAGGAFALLGTNSASFLVVTADAVVTCYTTLSPRYSFAGLAEITGTIYAVGTDAVDSSCVVVRFPTSTSCASSTVFSFGSIAGGATYSCNGIRTVSNSEFVIIGQTTLPTGSHPIMYVAKGTTSGTTKWEKTFDYGSATTGMAVTSLANGELIFVGYYSDLVLIRADSIGVQSENYGSGNTSFIGNAVTLTSDGAIVVGGNWFIDMFLRVLTICPVGDYLLPSPSTGCGPCISSCDKCTKGSDCTTCSSGFYLHTPTSTTYQCLSKCPAGYFAIWQTCTGCGTPTTCQTCLNSTYCYACQNGLYTQVKDFTSYCTDTCLTGYYKNYSYVSAIGANANVCTKCPSVCSACNNASSCTACSSGYYINGDSCIACMTGCSTCPSNVCTNCSDGYYLINAYPYCNPCLSNCASCTDSETCTTCYDGFILITSTSPHQCLSCTPNCKNCTGPSECSVCLPGYFLTPSSTCVAVCPTTFFANTDNATCQSCGTGCGTCLNPTYCIWCSSGGFLYYSSSGTRSCVSDCAAQGPYYPYYQYCYSCSSSCATCTSEAGCTSCPSGSYWQGAYCANVCSVGYYPDTNDMTCKLCMAGCLKCTSLGTCTESNAGYFVAAIDGSSNNTCAPCIPDCISCTSSSTCKQCSTGKYLYSTAPDPVQCMSVCPDYYFGSADGSCKSCVTNCKTCSNAKQCTTCGPSYFHYQPSSGSDQCLNPCLTGYYGDPASSPLMCKPCISPCLACTTSTYCTDCGTTLYIDPLTDTNNECSPSCRPYFYPLEKPAPKSCQPCLANCISCTNSTRCVVCDTAKPYIYTDTDGAVHCVSTCPESYLTSELSCIACPTGCQICSSQVDCQRCLPEYFEYQSPNSSTVSKQCLISCPIGYYGDTSTGICQHCHLYCLTCSAGPDSDQCDSCNLTLAYPLEDLSSTCVPDCQSLGYYRLGQVCKRRFSLNIYYECRLRRQLQEVQRPWAREVHGMYLCHLSPRREMRVLLSIRTVLCRPHMLWYWN